MSEKLAEVYAQYDMEILNVRKGRGATILSTTKGIRILEPFRGNITRLEQEYVLKQLFVQEGFINVDYLIPNRENMLFTCDKYRQPFVLKKHFDGEECDMHNVSDIVRAVKTLAVFHTYGKKVASGFETAWQKALQEKEEKRMEEIRQALENEEELEKISSLYEISESALEKILREREHQQDKKELQPQESTVKEKEIRQEQKGFALEEKGSRDMGDTFERHNKELRKIQKFISRVKRKNAFEMLFLQVFQEYYRQGLECAENFAQTVWKEEKIYTKEVLEKRYGICHGADNQHNVILSGDSEAVVHFERFSRGNQLNDLYQFARKVMEKNHFDFQLLDTVFQTYAKVIPLSKADYFIFYFHILKNSGK